VVERDDVRLLVNHEGLPLARTAAKTLTLASDAVGLRCDASLDRSSPLVASVLSAMERGDLDEMSFAFRVIRQEWDADYLERRITEVQLFDVSLVTYPANPATVAQVRDDVPAPSVRGLDLRMALAVRARLSI
jgi:HK97 family phage prohead protease